MDTDTRRSRARAAISSSAKGDFDSAVAEVIDLVSADWSCALAHRAWGRILLDQGKAVDAAESFRTSIALSPDDPELHFELALVLVEHAESAEYLELTSWIDARDAVLAGLDVEPDSALGRSLLEIIEGERERVLS